MARGLTLGVSRKKRVVVVTPDPPPLDWFIRPKYQFTSWLYLCKATRMKWTNAGGDWRDGAGVTNGATPTITAALPANGSVTIDVSGITGDLYITGCRVTSVYLDGVDITARQTTANPGVDLNANAAAFWIDPSSNGSLPIIGGGNNLVASGSGRPVIVTRSGGTSLVLTAYSGPYTVRIDAVARLQEAAEPAYTGTYTAPNIWEIDCTSDAAIMADKGYGSTASASPMFAGFHEYGTDSNGINYVRLQNSQSNQRLLDVTIPFGNRAEVYARYLIWYEDDVWSHMNELGVKCSGINGGGSFLDPTMFHCIGEHSGTATLGGTLNSRNEPMFGMDYYLRDAVTGPGFPVGRTDGSYSLLRPNRWYVHEIYGKLNTIGSADGELKIWINGSLVVDEAHEWRLDANSYWWRFNLLLYHGGLRMWTAPGYATYRLAKVAVSTQYIGVPSELLGSTYPAWRDAMPTVGTAYQIPNTANMSGLAVSNYQVNVWNGFAAGAHDWYAALNGGHGDVNNKVIRIDLSQDVPTWVLLHNGSALADIPPPIPGNDYGSGPYNLDGLPASRHTYFHTHVVASRNRVMAFVGRGYNWGGAGVATDGYDIAANAWDAAGTWPNCPVPNITILTCALDSRTDDIYLGQGGQFTKWTAATGLFTMLTVTKPGTWQQWAWEYKGSLIDAGRNRWVHLGDTRFGDLLCHLLWIGLGSNVGAIGPVVTGPYPGTAQNYQPIVHDTDNDLYVTIYDNGTSCTIYTIHPDTGVSAVLASGLPRPVNGVQSRLTYFQEFGGVAYLPQFSSNIYFVPTV